MERKEEVIFLSPLDSLSSRDIKAKDKKSRQPLLGLWKIMIQFWKVEEGVPERKIALWTAVEETNNRISL
jgi:hypothetical protein